MASLKEILSLCREGKAQKAYELSKADMTQQFPWAQREMGWSLYYLMKDDTDTNNYQSLVAHLDEFSTLDQLSLTDDNMLFENVLFKVAGFVKAHVSATGIDSSIKLSTIFLKLHGYSFEPSRGYSFLLQSFIKCDSWLEMADFLDWWNLEKLMEEDYMPFKMDNGRTIMSVAEQAFIAKSKALLRLNDLGRIEEFLPLMDDLMEKHPEMTYPGYFYGKLLLSLGSTAEDALKVIIPFARKKATEFWVWQLLSDVFVNDQEKQLACLLRAVNCRTQENFLGKVRIKLATLYIQRNQLDYAKYQIDKVTECYLSQGWHLPYEVDCWIHQPWINTINTNKNSPVDYMAITDTILCEGTEEAVAVVTNVDTNSHKATLVYGYKKRISQKIRIKVGPGAVLKINYITEPDDRIRILSSGQVRFQNNLDFAKVVEGTVRKRTDKEFAFLKTKNDDYYISPNTVRKYGIQDGEKVQSLIVYDYNKKKETWNWACISINKKK